MEPTLPGTARSARTWALLLVLSANMLIDAIEVSVVVVAMPSIAADLGQGVLGAHWPLTAFALGFGGTVLLAGRLAERFGRRRSFLVALLSFAVASLLGAAADDIALLALTRFVKGVCVALTAPTGLAIIGAAFRERRARATAVAVYSLAGAGGFTVGLLLSGVLTSVSWRWTLLLPAPVALVLLLFARRIVPVDAGRRGGGSGLMSAAALSAAAVSLACGVLAVREPGWTHPLTAAAFAGAVLAAAGFVVAERRCRPPLLRTGPFRVWPRARSVLGAAALNGSFWGLLVIASLHLQQTAGWSPMAVGAAMLPASVLLAGAAPVAGRLVGRFGTAVPIAVGAALPPLGYALYPAADQAPSYLAVAPTMVLTGAGFALGFSALHLQVTAGVPDEDRAAVSGAYQTAVQLGGALAVVVVAALIGRDASGGLDLGAAHAFVTSVGVAGLVVALGSKEIVARP